MKSYKQERIEYWLKKDPTLTTLQLQELTGASSNLICKVKKEMGLDTGVCPITHAEMDRAFKKFLCKRGKKIATREDFNPPRYRK